MAKLNLDKEIFTTFEVAKLCNANITSIKNWIEKNKLRAFKTPGGHYRIERDVLKTFLDEYGMPNPFRDRTDRKVMVLCKEPATVELVRRGVGRDVQVEGTDDPIEGALMVGAMQPDCLIIDVLMEGSGGLHMVRKIREHNQFNRTRIIVYSNTDDVDLEHDAREAGVNHFIRTTEGIDALKERVIKELN